ncbi:MAG TPA: zinc ABC transporter substrate-binding protein [Candidatus Binatia bacterium]|nr:zinc ABC transporter substrate-binding protein [Candidatus Binatia bacterium]
MKNILMLLAALAAAQPAAAAIKVFTCEPEWAALARELGGDDVEAYSASTAVQDVHKVQARPSLIAKYRQADLVACTGAELEIGWLPALAEKGNNPRVLAGRPGFFEASAYVHMLEVPSSVDRSMGDVHPFGNPHVQTGPQNIAPVAQALAQRLAELDPPHADAYRRRHADFAARWQQALERWKVRAAPLKDVPVISHHKTWAYLYDWLGIRQVALLEPKPGIPPSGAHLEEVLAIQKAQPARMVVYSSYEDPRPAQWLSQRAGIPAVQLPFSVGGVPGTDDLFGFYQALLDRLLQGAAAAPAVEPSRP